MASGAKLSLSVSSIHHLVCTLCEVQLPLVLYLQDSVSPALCNCLVMCQQRQSQIPLAPSWTLPIRSDYDSDTRARTPLGSCSLWRWFVKEVENAETGHGQSQSTPLSVSRRSISTFRCKSDIRDLMCPRLWVCKLVSLVFEIQITVFDHRGNFGFEDWCMAY